MYAHNKSMAFPVPFLWNLCCSTTLCVWISYTKLYQSQIMNAESTRLSLSFGASACTWVGLHLGVLEQFRFYEVVLWTLPPTPSYPGGLMGCLFIWFLTTNLPGMGGRKSSYATASIAWLIIGTHKPCHHFSRSCNP